MGFFQLATGISSVLMGYMALDATKMQGITNPLQTNHMYMNTFLSLGFYSLLLGIAAIIFTPWFAKVIRERIVTEPHA